MASNQEFHTNNVSVNLIFGAAVKQRLLGNAGLIRELTVLIYVSELFGV